MKLTQLAAKPKLIKVEMMDDEIQELYGESLEFWIWDRQPMDKFVKLAQMSSDNMGDLIQVVNDMVLDEQGKRIISDEEVLPTNIMTKVIGKVVETLGK